MSHPLSHAAYRLVRRAIDWADVQHRFLVTQAKAPQSFKSYKNGPWEVRITTKGYTYDYLYEMSLQHYATTMILWHYNPQTGKVLITGTWTGHGSASDQQGVNAAMRALGSPLRYSRIGVTKGRHRETVDPSAARINRRR